MEGYKTTESFAGLCAERGIDAPILREAHAILFQGKKPAAALQALMTRGLKRETSARGAGARRAPAGWMPPLRGPISW